MSNISISSPFLTSFTHADFSVGTTASSLLSAVSAGQRRVMTVIQNKNGTAAIQVILNATGTSGILVPAKSNLSLDNYNGPIRCISDTAATPVHVAYAIV
jgi:hypothetical protein